MVENGLDFKMQTEAPNFIAIVSPERFRRYLAWASGDNPNAISLYTLNCQLSEALYLPLQMLEIALRNRIDQVGSSLARCPDETYWFELPQFQKGSRQKAQIAEARQTLLKNRKIISQSQIISTLTFGYWTSFLGPEYEDLWQSAFHRIAQKGLRRKDFSQPLFLLRKLRNRIAHHEPIIHWDLGKHHDEILKLTAWLSPTAAHWSTQHSRFRRVYPRTRIVLNENA